MDGGHGRASVASVPALIGNLETQMSRMDVRGVELRLSRNDGVAQTGYLCCPTTAYIDYALEELRHVSALPGLKGALAVLIGALRPLVRASGLDRQVQPNNSLMSTCLLPDLAQADIAAVTRGLVRQWPGHAIVWRSLVEAKDKTLFRAAGYRLLPSRQVWLFDARQNLPRRHRDEGHDARLLKRRDYRLVPPDDIEEGDFARIHDLYRQLYIGKYSALNPDYTPSFFRQAHTDGDLKIFGFRNGDGVIDAFTAFVEQGDAFTAPMCGYDLGLPRELGLYRRLMALGLEKARQEGRLYNMSAGAAAFKRTRGGVAAIEYMAVYDRHLSLPKRSCITVMSGLLNALAIPLVKRFSL